MSTNFKAYYRLAKPGIVYGNLVVAIGGYIYGARGDIELLTFVGLAAGTAFIIACGCVVNNYLDQDIDKLMRRTQKRALVTGAVPGRFALIYAAGLGTAGFLLLAAYTNTLTVIIGAIGLIGYALVYTFAKPRTVHATLIGTIPGATPPVAGYVAATGTLDASAWLLFFLMVFWQMVHFYAIAMYRQNDYKKAGVPVLPVVRGDYRTAQHMYVYTLAFLVAVCLMVTMSYANILWLIVMVPLGVWWFMTVRHGLTTSEPVSWARSVFYKSLPILPVMAIMLAISGWMA